MSGEERVQFPEKLGFLTLARELDVRPRVAVYVCSCGREVKRTLTNARSAHVRSSFSACSKCRTANNHKRRVVR
jgi:hypothetical protein